MRKDNKMANVQRVRRASINGTRNKIPQVLNPDPDYVYRYVYDTDEDNRVDSLMEMGYEVVDKGSVKVSQNKRVAEANALGSQITVQSGKNRLVLMRQKREYYEEDKKAKEANVDKTEEGMKAPGQGLVGEVKITR
jgi:acetyl/propionyl-CoA carboxylase alpha subunit